MLPPRAVCCDASSSSPRRCAVGIAFTLADARDRAAAARGGRRGLHHRRRSQWPAAARLHDARWPLAAAARGRGGRPALPRHAGRLRGQALPRASRRRSLAVLRAGWLLVRHGRLALRRLDPDHADRPPASTACMSGRRPASSGRWRARAAARAAAVEGRDPRALSPPRPVRRQHRGHARGLPRLFRQGAAAALRSARRHCWSRCRSRPRPAGPTAIPRRRAGPATVSSTACTRPA